LQVRWHTIWLLYLLDAIAWSVCGGSASHALIQASSCCWSIISWGLTVVGVSQAGARLRLRQAVSCDKSEASVCIFFRKITMKCVSRNVSTSLTVSNMILV
jgi:hypothetical protein